MSAIEVLKIYPKATVVKDGQYQIIVNDTILGVGPSKKAAWKSSLRNIDGR